MWPSAPIQLRHREATRDPSPPLRLPIRPRSSPIAPAVSAGWPCRRTHGCSETLGLSLGLFLVSSGYPVAMSKRINRRNVCGAPVPLQSALHTPRSHSCQQVDELLRQGIRGHGDSIASPCAGANINGKSERVRSAKNRTCRVGSCSKHAVAQARPRVDGCRDLRRVSCAPRIELDWGSPAMRHVQAAPRRFESMSWASVGAESEIHRGR
jgi:hypothetical protein